jgi:hypothetical protein
MLYPLVELQMQSRARLAIGFAVACALLYTIVSTTSRAVRDPTSVFFNPSRGYAPKYSEIRRKQAEAFIAAYDETKAATKASSHGTRLCVGIPSLKREGAGYLADAVGSLLEGLTTRERQDIYVVVFIPHSDPSVHQAYNEAWLPGLVDHVLTYEYGDDRMQYIRDMEQEGGRFLEKGLFDYSYLLTKCAEQYTPYIAIFEDDTVAMDGWYHRTIAAIHDAEQQAALRRSRPDFLYLRLFYTEEFLGWNAENWKLYLWRSICVAAIPTTLLFLLRAYRPQTKLVLTLTSPRAFWALYAGLGGVILFFFALGRVTVLPISPGVHEMPQFGCCSQAFVFPSTKARDLVSYFKDRHTGYMDVMTEEYANERNELRFAITPSVVQHVGRKSSKGDDYGPMSKWGLSVAEKIWSFSFETLDWRVLRREHEENARLVDTTLSTTPGTRSV